MVEAADEEHDQDVEDDLEAYVAKHAELSRTVAEDFYWLDIHRGNHVQVLARLAAEMDHYIMTGTLPRRVIDAPRAVRP